MAKQQHQEQAISEEKKLQRNIITAVRDQRDQILMVETETKTRII